MEERRIFITWAACLGNYLFDWSNVILQYSEKKDKFIFVVNSQFFPKLIHVIVMDNKDLNDFAI